MKEDLFFNKKSKDKLSDRCLSAAACPKFRRGRSKKLYKPWIGPCIVTNIVSDVNYGTQHKRLFGYCNQPRKQQPCKEVVIKHTRSLPPHSSPAH